ncbi:DUF2812 domain-containing protein [Ornithinibacillus xuwenensis]|jgi:Protein of unknown function (DUF2812)|uniref:DUF2812 domain-containing protein n=1 Tax=Ornithinibacillus xuwenensis TaxID=3144668 RepID=A0ABU9XKU1_9BACI
MTKKKFKLFLAYDVEKEEKWLTEMSTKGLHLKKYRLFTYTFEENKEESYIYQVDFRPDAKEDYFRLYEDAGWEHVTGAVNLFHYFRVPTSQQDIQKIYSDKESILESYKRMMSYYLMIFFLCMAGQLALVLSWKGYFVQYLAAGLVLIVIVLYINLFISLKLKINYYRRN